MCIHKTYRTIYSCPSLFRIGTNVLYINSKYKYIGLSILCENKSGSVEYTFINRDNKEIIRQEIILKSVTTIDLEKLKKYKLIIKYKNFKGSVKVRLLK